MVAAVAAARSVCSSAGSTCVPPSSHLHRPHHPRRVILDALRATTPAQADKAAQWTHTLDSLEQRSELSAPRRTPANAFFPPALYRPLKAALVEYGERTLGCRGLAPLWLT